MEWRSASLRQYLDQGVFYTEGLAVIKREAGRVTIRCGFCNGTGRSMGEGVCPSCAGRKSFVLDAPVVRCGYCRGTGRTERHATTTCPTCRGRGAHAVATAFKICPLCNGSGRKGRSRLCCLRCSGKAVVSNIGYRQQPCPPSN